MDEAAREVYVKARREAPLADRHKVAERLAPEPLSTLSREPLWTWDFILVSLANLAVFTGFQMLMPTMPVYVKSLGGPESVMGLVIGVFTLSALGVRPLVGRTLDTMGRRQVFLVGLAVFVVSALSYRWASTIGLLLGIRLLHGSGWGFSTTAAGTIAADVIPRTRLGEGMGFFGLSTTVAMAVAPALGLYVIRRFGFPVLFYGSACFALLALLLASLIRHRPGGGQPPRGRGSGLFEPRAVKPGLVMFLSNTTYGAIVTFLAIYAAERGIANIGPFFTVYAATLALTRPLSGLVLDRRGFDVVVIPGLACVGAAMALLAVARSLETFLLAAVLYGVGFGTVQPAMQALAVRGLPPYRRGAANGTFYIGFDLGIGLGAVVWGVVSQSVGYPGMYLTAVIPAGLALAAYFAVGRSAGR